MKNKVSILLLWSSVLLALVAFQQSNDDALFSVPTNFPKPAYHFERNPLTADGIELGKTLFYDAIISSDNTVSCGSCHQQSAGFTQHGHAFSHGVNDLLTKRNAMPLYNLAWATSFGWDGGVHDLDLFAVSPITNPVEMNESMAGVLTKLRSSPLYPALFKKAFGSTEINTERFLKALSQFMLTMVSANSKYDRYVRYEGIELDTVELEGLAIFKQKCANCHAGELFTDFSFRNNGLPLNNHEDLGRFEVNQTESDKYKFKVPSLRNLRFTAPYMHDGRFTTLEQVLEHYATKVEKTPSLDPSLYQNDKLGISLTKDEQKKIILFLKTLDDEEFIKRVSLAESSLNTSIVMKDIDEEVKKLSLNSPRNIELINNSCTVYLKTKEALFKKETHKVVLLIEKFYHALNKIDRKAMPLEARNYFDNMYNNIVFDAEHIIEGKDSYEHQFAHFAELSAHFYKLMASFKPNTHILYYYECPTTKFAWLSNLANEGFPTATGQICRELKKRTIVP